MAINKKCYPSVKVLIFLLLIAFPQILSAQKKDSTISKINNFTGVVTFQTKGISTIPNLTLGKPAAVFDMKMGRKLTFEPQFRFALDGKPWAMVFWWRYYYSMGNKFRTIFSTNYSLSYKTVTNASYDPPQQNIRTTRYLVGAIEPIYQLNKYFDLGLYLFYNYGLEKFITRNTYMFSFRPSISNIPVTKNIIARINPEIYYLKLDKNDGIYFNARFLVTKKNCPISLSALINKPLNSNIPAAYDLLWNVGVSYTFNKKYIESR
jgi:hypothetical protein